MSTTTNQKIILNGSPFAWLHKITDGTITELWKFDNLQSSTYKLPKPGSDSGNSENVDIKRADGAIIRFPKQSLILSGVDETDITPADSSSDATGKGEITLITNEAPNESNSWTAFLKSLKTEKNSLFLVTIGTGFSHKARTDATYKKPEGYVHLIGKINTDIEQQFGENATTLTLTIASYTNSGIEVSDLTDAELFSAIDWKLGGAGKNISGIKPPAITEPIANDLLAGDLAIVTHITYS